MTQAEAKVQWCRGVLLSASSPVIFFPPDLPTGLRKLGAESLGQ